MIRDSGMWLLTFKEIKEVIKLKTLFISLLLFLIAVLALTLAVTKINDPFWKVFMSSVSGALLGASSVSLIDRFFFSQDILVQVRAIINESEKLSPLAGYGLVNMNYRTNITFDTFLRDAIEHVKAMGISLPMMCTERTQIEIIQRLKKMDDPVIFKFLILNPLSAEYFNRSKSPCYPDFNRYINFSHRCIEQFLEIGQALMDEDIFSTDRFDVRMFNSIPYSSIIIRDRIANVCGFLENERGSTGTYVEFQDTGARRDMYSKLCTHFDIVWNKSISLFDPRLKDKLQGQAQQWNEAFQVAMDQEAMTIDSLPTVAFTGPNHNRV